MHHIYLLFKKTVQELEKYHISPMAASLAYFGLFATAPIILITITILQLFLSDLQIRNSLVEEVRVAAGPQIANTIQTILINSNKNTPQHLIYQLITIITLVVTATTLFMQLRYTLNTLWEITPKKSSSLLRDIRTRLLSLIGIIAAGISFYVFFVLSILINLLGAFIESMTGYNPWVLQNINLIISFFFIIGIFACVFKYVPEAEISWMDAAVGATITASIFTIGRYLLTLYFSWNIIGTIYGTAGSLLVFLVWIYFSALIFLFGAKLTHVYANSLGNGIHNR